MSWCCETRQGIGFIWLLSRTRLSNLTSAWGCNAYCIASLRMCVSRPLAHHLSCAHFTASLKYHRYMKHIPLIHNYVCYLYRKTLRIKKVENWFYNIDSSSGFFFVYIYLKVLFSGWQSHMQEMGTSPKHTWVVPFFTLLWTQGWHFHVLCVSCYSLTNSFELSVSCESYLDGLQCLWPASASKGDHWTPVTLEPPAMLLNTWLGALLELWCQQDIPLSLFGCGAGNWTQALTHSRHLRALPLNHITSPPACFKHIVKVPLRAV